MFRAPFLDDRTFSKLASGQVSPQARLDLHGLTRDEAVLALRDFMADCFKTEARCLLIVTGKGAGILRRFVPSWIEQSYASSLLALVSASARHGGEGAFYVLLKRTLKRQHGA